MTFGVLPQKFFCNSFFFQSFSQEYPLFSIFCKRFPKTSQHGENNKLRPLPGPGLASPVKEEDSALPLHLRVPP